MNSRLKKVSFFTFCTVLCVSLGLGLALFCLARPLQMKSREVDLYAAVNQAVKVENGPYSELRAFINYCKREWDRAALASVGVTIANVLILFLVKWDCHRKFGHPRQPLPESRPLEERGGQNQP